MVRARGDKGTMDLLGWMPERVGAAAPALRGPVDTVLPRLVSDVLKAATKRGLEREEVAHALTLRLNRKVSKDTLDAWASPGRASNRIPADALVTLMVVTGDLAPLDWMAAQLGQALVAEEHADVVRDVVLVRDIEAKERELAAVKAAAAARLGRGGGR